MKKFKSRKEIKQEIKDNATLNEDGMSYDEIATILGISKFEVKKIENEALRKLQVPNSLNKKFKNYLGGGFIGES